MATFNQHQLLVQNIDPTIIEAQKQVNAYLAQMPHPDVRTPDGLAALRAGTANNANGTELTPTDASIPGPSGELRLHIFEPDGAPRAVMLRIHGGGWAAGSPEDDDTLNDQLARAAHIAIVSPEYRLVPDVTVVDQIADTVAAAKWLAANAAARFGTDRLLIGGISAGGHLAAATLVALHTDDASAFKQFEGALLDCGAYDLGGTPSMVTSTEQTLILTHDWLYGLLEIGLPGYSVDQRRVPALSPALADLTSMPPALFTVGDLDPLRDDSIILSARWELAGGHADLDIWPEGAHAFTNMATPLGAIALERTIDWISALLDGEDTAPLAVVQRFIDQVVNGGDIDALSTLWSGDLEWHGGSMGDIHGLSAFTDYMRANASGAFSDMHLDVHETLVSGDKVVVRFTNSGKQTGPFMGTPASGKSASWLGIGIYTVHAGRITEAWFGEDILGMMLQLGAITLPTA